MFLRVARILIANQIKAYRVHKFILFFDSLLLLLSAFIVISAFMAFRIPSFAEFIKTVYTTITSYISIRELIIKTSAAISALFYLSVLFGQDFFIVSRDQYPILIHPVSFTDFTFGKILSETFILLRFNYVILAALYGLTYIAGNRFSALAAFGVYVLGIVYISALSNLILLLKRFKLVKILSATLLLLSIYDLAKNTVTASYPIYVLLNAIVGCYTNYARTFPFFIAFFVSIALLYYSTVKFEPEFEMKFAIKKEKRFTSLKVRNPISKTFVELYRMKIIYVLFLSAIAYPLGFILKSLIPNFMRVLLSFLPICVMAFSGLVEYVLRQEAEMIWLYKVTNSTRQMALNMITKGYVAYFTMLLPLILLTLPIKASYLALSAASLVIVIVPIQSIGAVAVSKKVKFKSVRMSGMHSSYAIYSSVNMLYLILEVLLITTLVILALTIKNPVIIVVPSVIAAVIGTAILNVMLPKIEV